MTESITDIIEGMKDLADDILGKGEIDAEQDKINRYCEQSGRPLANGNIKNLRTGEEQEPVSRNLDDIPPDLGSNGAE